LVLGPRVLLGQTSKAETAVARLSPLPAAVGGRKWWGKQWQPGAQVPLQQGQTAGVVLAGRQCNSDNCKRNVNKLI